MRSRALVFSIVVALGSACDEPAPAAAPAATAPAVAAVDVTPLDAAATPLREWFEANAGKPRFITIVSPT